MVFSVQSLSHVWVFATSWTAARQASLSITNTQSLLKLMSVELLMPSNHLVFWSFSFSISPFSEYPGLICFRIDWFDLCFPRGSQEFSLAPQFGSISSLLYSPTPISMHDYWKKTIALTIWTFVSKEVSLLFNTLSRFVIAFLPRSKRLLLSWLQSPSAVFGAQENNIYHCFHCFPICLL